MHEISLVRSLLSQVQKIANENDASSASEVVIEIGPLSGVEPDLIQIAFEQLVGDDAIPSLVIQPAPLIVLCKDCDQESELTEFTFQCDRCDSRSVKIIRGDEFRLLSVTLNQSTADV